MAASTTPIFVYIVDDDEGVRRALARVFRSAGLETRQFSSTHEFLDAEVNCHRSCVIADLTIADEEPTELPGRLKGRGLNLPVVFVSADDSRTSREKVRAAGGLGLYRKPVDSQALIDSVRWAVEGQKESG